MNDAKDNGRAVKETHLRDDKHKPGTVPVGEIATIPGGNSPDSAMCEDRTRPGRINNSKDC